jgi:hypothetical protein
MMPGKGVFVDHSMEPFKELHEDHSFREDGDKE